MAVRAYRRRSTDTVGAPGGTGTKRVVRNNSSRMRERRARILQAARTLIVERGIAGFNIRDLAKSAEVALPTIYSLIGSKEQVMVALFAESITEVERHIVTNAGLDPLGQVEAVVLETIALYKQDEDYYRASQIAIEHLDGTEFYTIERVTDPGERLLCIGFQACIEAGLLRNNLGVRRLAELTMQSYRVTWRKWAFGQMTLDELRREALVHAYIILMSDASGPFRKSLLGKIAEIESEASGNPVPAQDPTAQIE